MLFVAGSIGRFSMLMDVAFAGLRRMRFSQGVFDTFVDITLSGLGTSI